ncbi:uncharacterized protein LOC100180379 [Ciona intestinalis]
MATFYKISILAMFAISMVVGQAPSNRRCWFCENANHLLDCLQRGREIQCKQQVDVCYMEFQSSKMFMGCKEDSSTQSCTVQVGQNPNQCHVPFRTTRSDVANRCTCCCDNKDYCNSAFDTPCIYIPDPPTCPPIAAPGNGTKTCSNPDSNLIPGTECWFECNSGFYAEGPTHSTCELSDNKDTATFKPKAPKCKPLCPPNAVLDVVFAIEITTSMSSVLKLKKIAGAVIRKFSIGSTDTKIGLVGFRGGSINPMVSQLKERKTQPDLISFLNALTFTSPGMCG